MRGKDLGNGAKNHMISDNVPEVEVEGPFGNSFHIFITDIDGDVIVLNPGQARRLQKKLTKALLVIGEKRPAKYGHFVKEAFKETG